MLHSLGTLDGGSLIGHSSSLGAHWPHSRSIARMSTFVQGLTSMRDGNQVLRALVRGALVPWNAGVGTLHRVSSDEQSLLMAGQCGLNSTMVKEFSAIPIDLPLPNCHSYLTDRPLFLSADRAMAEFPLLRYLVESLPELGHQTIACLPLHVSAIPAGVLTVTVGSVQNPHLDDADVALLDALAGVLSLWLLATDNPSEVPRHSTGGTLMITERQRLVLEGIRAGHTNAVIAAHLGFAESTIKADLTAMYRVFGAAHRDELLRRAAHVGI